MDSKTVRLGTDVAALVLFHPDDLAHRQNDPVAWYGYDFAFSRESARGRLVAFGTGSDGTYEVRITTGLLTPQEITCACPSRSFPLVVRHGRLLLDNTDALPSLEQMIDPATIADRWYEIASGTYRVVVHPIDRRSGAALALPDYVIVFEAVDNTAAIAVASTPPCLRPYRDRGPSQPPSMQSEDWFVWPEAKPDRGAFPLLVVSERSALLPRQYVTLTVSEDVASAVYPDRGRKGKHLERLVAAPAFPAGGWAALVRVGGLMRGSGRSPTLGIQCEHIVRVLECSAPQPLQLVHVEPVSEPDALAPADKARLLQQRLQRYAAENSAFQIRLKSASFELERLASFRSAEAITTWALMYVDWPFVDRLACYASAIKDRITMIDQFLLEELR
jgi:Family of unknown function (DUF6386)